MTLAPSFDGVELIRADAPMLHEEMPEWVFPEDARPLYKFLSDEILKRGALGAAANQFGIRSRAFVMRADPMIICINPSISWSSEDKVLLEEGCLSYPGLFIKIERPRSIRAKWFDPEGNLHTELLDGITARVFQHELDHLLGIDFTTRAKPMARMLALKKQQDWQRNQKKLRHQRGGR